MSNQTREKEPAPLRRSFARVEQKRCPYCGGSYLFSDNYFEKVYEGKKEMVRQEAGCKNCGREWWDVFVLSGIEDRQQAEGQ